MSSKTTNYNLHKIDLTDAPPDITTINVNWDTIDEQLKTLETEGGKVKSVNGKIGEVVLNATDVGARPSSWIPTASDVGSIKLYKSLSELGLEEETARPIDIVFAMDNQSMLLAEIGDGENNFPPGTGLLTVIKQSNNFTRFEWQSNVTNELQDARGVLYVGYYNGALSTPWSGWNEVAIATKFLPLDGSVAMTGELKYTDGTNTYEYYGEHNPLYTYGTTDLTAGTSELETGKLYFVYE